MNATLTMEGVITYAGTVWAHLSACVTHLTYWQQIRRVVLQVVAMMS